MGKNHPNVDDYVVSRVRALESLLLEKGLLAPDAVDRVVQRYEASTGPDDRRPRGGARVAGPGVPRAAPPASRRPRSPISASDYDRARRRREHAGRPQPGRLHALLLLSLGVMGLPPTWYKMPAYRSRAVSEPRAVLAEFGLVVPPEREVRVWDSSAELRYMVLPMPPRGRRGPGRGRAGVPRSPARR